MATGKRIGIFGGSFDPVHLGHLIMAQMVSEQAGLDVVVFVPCCRQPLKRATPPAPGHHRLAMLAASVAGNSSFSVSDSELERGGISYSVETVRAFQLQFPHDDLFLMMGTDTLADLHRWREVGTLLTLCTPLVVRRPGFDPAALDPDRLRLPPAIARRVIAPVAVGIQIDISSTLVRNRVARGLDIRYLVNQPVDDYIRTHGLYRPDAP